MAYFKDIETHVCEYNDCTRDAKTYDEVLEVWLCKKHEDVPTNHTGYCSRDCQLGYGCDQSC